MDNIYAKSWTITNTATQDVSVGLIGAYRRHMANQSCATAEKVENIAFSLRNLATGAYVTDSYGKQYNWLTYWGGNGWLNFNNLPAGSYKVVIRAGSATTTGDMPYAVEAKSASVAVTLL